MSEHEGWHAPGLGEVHNADHSVMIDCMRLVSDANDDEPDYLMNDEIAARLAALLNANPGALAPRPPLKEESNGN